MKQMVRVLFLAFLVIPILTVTQVKANGPSDRGGRDSFLEELLQDIFGHHDYHPRGNDNGSWSGNNGKSGSSSDNGGTRAPLDGGLSLLLAAGIGLGVKKAFKKNDNKEESNELV